MALSWIGLTFTRNLGVGVSMVFESTSCFTVFEILGHFLFKGGQDHPIYHQMFLDTRNKNIYGLGVGISIIFEIFSNFLLKGWVGGYDPRGHI
jgi:hypothetical protein